MIDIRWAALLLGMVVGYVAPWYVGLTLVVALACWTASGRVGGWLYRRGTVEVDQAVIERLQQTAIRRQRELRDMGGAQP